MKAEGSRVRHGRWHASLCTRTCGRGTRRPTRRPDNATVSSKGPSAAAVNVAVTVCSPDMSTARCPLPPHAPLQPAKLDPALGAATNGTELPLAHATAHRPTTVPCAMEHESAGDVPGLVTEPAPVPLPCTRSVYCQGSSGPSPEQPANTTTAAYLARASARHRWRWACDDMVELVPPLYILGGPSGRRMPGS
jgi:hypothetical protein